MTALRSVHGACEYLCLLATAASPTIHPLRQGSLVCADTFTPMTPSAYVDIELLNTLMYQRWRFTLLSPDPLLIRLGVSKTIRFHLPSILPGEEALTLVEIDALRRWLDLEEARAVLECWRKVDKRENASLNGQGSPLFVNTESGKFGADVGSGSATFNRKSTHSNPLDWSSRSYQTRVHWNNFDASVIRRILEKTAGETLGLL